MLDDIERDTVDFIDNYDGTKQEPVVLPSPVPQLLLNGILGIAVGMATNIPPHNLSEVIDASIHLLHNPKADTEDIFEFIKILRYFEYLKGFEFAHSVQKWLDDIVFVDEVYACREFFDKKGEFEISKDSSLYGLHEALKRNKEELKNIWQF